VDGEGARALEARQRASAPQDWHPNRTLQFQDGAAQRRLLNFESTRGAVEAAVIRRRDGVAKLANIE
jgi:hypothetical protein